jgi:D-alanyl-D-alanine carboxypeptidase (penicillin-binding protein 5/6)
MYSFPLDISVGAEEAILMNARTGQILFEKNAQKPAYPASTTKIATALLALYKFREKLDTVFVAEKEALASITPQAKLQSHYRSPPYWLETDSTHIGIKRGEEMKLSDLLYALLVASANDAANVIAQGVGGSIPQFVDEMNAYLKHIGCKNTHFNNPSGLHHPEHVTTAYDLAVMTRKGLQDPLFRRMVASSRYTFPKTNLEYERTLIQSNRLLKQGEYQYKKALGVKTGTTQAAGKNLVAAAQDGDRILIAVALGYRSAKGEPRTELYRDVTKMFETAFQEQKVQRILLPSGEQKKITRLIGRRSLKTYLADPLVYAYYPSEEVAIKASIQWEVPPLPIAVNDRVGKIHILDEQERILHAVPLYALECVQPSLWYHCLHSLLPTHPDRKKRYFQVVFAAGCLATPLMCRRFFRKKNYR